MTAQFLDKKTIAELTARMYLDIGAVRFMEDKPFIFTSGWASPVYNDSRWLISFPDVRSTLMDFAVHTIERDIGRDKINAVAGGETAGIPFAAWVADRMHLPMQYVRKKPKGFGRGAQIEGLLIPGQRVLLVEDLATDGKSKANFINAIREAGGKCEHCFVIFFYDIYPQSKKIMGDLGVTLHALTTWKDVLAVAKTSGEVRAEDAGRGGEVHRRSGRLVESPRRRRRGGGVALPYMRRGEMSAHPRESGDPAQQFRPCVWPLDSRLRGNERSMKTHPTFAGLTSSSIASPPNRAPTETAKHPGGSKAAARAWSRRPSADPSANRALPVPCRSNLR